MSGGQEVRMPFGKHKGTPVKDVPGDYLAWLSENVPLRGDLAEAVKEVLSRKANPTTPTPRSPQPAPRAPRPVAPAKPKRAWMPRPEDEDLSAYYSQGSNDGIGF